MTIAPIQPTIYVKGEPLPAAICPTCGGRIYPASAMGAHLEHHELIKKYGHEPGPVTRRKMMQATR